MQGVIIIVQVTEDRVLLVEVERTDKILKKVGSRAKRLDKLGVGY